MGVQVQVLSSAGNTSMREYAGATVFAGFISGGGSPAAVFTAHKLIGTLQHFYIAYLLPFFEVVVYNDLIVIKINGIYEHVNYTLPKLHIKKITARERL